VGVAISPADNGMDREHDILPASASVRHALREATGDPDLRLRIRQTLSRLGPATVSPGALMTLLEAGQSVEEVTAAIRQCGTLSARVISVINSAAYGLSREVTSLQRAVSLLGPSRARSIAMAYGLRTITERLGIPRDIADVLWAGSLAKAAAAQKFCEQIDPEQAETAYSLALIQDIGLPMLMAVDLSHYQNHIIPAAARTSWSACEREHFGFDHASVGQGLILEWQGNSQLQQSVLNHHRTPPEPSSVQETGLQLSLFMASLMPHMHEEPSTRQVEWIQALHAQFLSKAYASPEEFFRCVSDATFEIRSAAMTAAANHDVLVKRLINEVAANTIGVTSKLCRIEHRLGRERQDFSELKFQAFTDPLTKVLNRRGFTQLSQRRLEVAAEQGLGVCCMLSDMDEFKAVNDNFGHEVGDQVLRGLAKMMRRTLNANDLVGRLGGDEFAIFIIGVDQQQAMEAAQKLVDSIQGVKLRVRADLEVPVYFSLGAVYCNQDLNKLSIDDLLTLADQAMYERKRQSKHGLVFTTHPPEGTIANENPNAKIRRSNRPPRSPAFDEQDD
jgi:diguanylate cyclase (GGDEF)-like protein